MIAFVFPGQGAQKVGMGRSLADAFPICRDTFAEADAALGEPLSTLCFDGPDDRLMLTENTQPAILAMSTAVARLAVSRGIRPRFAAGHSLGEYSAHVAAGTLSFADALRTVRRRGRYMQEAVPVGDGAMAAILGLDADGVAKACAEAADGQVVSPANLNAPGQIVIAGHAQAVARAGERAKALGAKRAIPLAGQRAVPLRADEAGRGSARARAARPGRERSGVPGRRQRRRPAEDDRRRRDRGARPAGVVARCAGRTSCADSSPTGPRRSSSSGPGSCSRV